MFGSVLRFDNGRLFFADGQDVEPLDSGGFLLRLVPAGFGLNTSFNIFVDVCPLENDFNWEIGTGVASAAGIFLSSSGGLLGLRFLLESG